MEISVQQVLPAHLKIHPQNEAALGFGDIYTDHIFKMDYFAGAWRNPRIEPFASFQLSPAAMV
ncbi:MAG: branched chain amino acid aminotransferase, partial [Deltaproteobacteria bacterium]|nr:branched chain amino acid aminotransferase [Deltaproteobacteria bacterium]